MWEHRAYHKYGRWPRHWRSMRVGRRPSGLHQESLPAHQVPEKQQMRLKNHMKVAAAYVQVRIVQAPVHMRQHVGNDHRGTSVHTMSAVDQHLAASEPSLFDKGQYVQEVCGRRVSSPSSITWATCKTVTCVGRPSSLAIDSPIDTTCVMPIACKRDWLLA